jgi:hypothetical protein
MSGESHRKERVEALSGDVGENTSRKTGKKKENSARALFLGENDSKPKTKPPDVGHCRKQSSKHQSSSLRFSGKQTFSVKSFSMCGLQTTKQKKRFLVL